ncbi:MAG: HAD family hydrolase [Chloroflexota bacterium]
MIKAIIFDLDQTLLNRIATFTRFLEQQYNRFKHELHSVKAADFVTAILKHDNNGYTPKIDVYNTVCTDWNIPIQKALLDDFHEKYGTEPILNVGALEVLQQLNQRYILGLITNGRAKGQNAKIDGASIRHYFKAIKISEIEGIKKPDPRIFERCLHDLGVAAAQAVYIGDHPEKDVAAAQRVGMKGIWLSNSNYVRPDFADGVIFSLKELQKPILLF